MQRNVGISISLVARNKRMLTTNLFLLHSQVDSDGDTEEMVLPQYHHCSGG